MAPSGSPRTDSSKLRETLPKPETGHNHMLTVIIAAITTASGTPTLALSGNDPIELLKGKEVVGSEKYTASYLRHKYHFSNHANLATFKNDPVKYSVQAGGACGKMGALTGKGSPDRWLVTRGKIFLFASDGCRTTFQANEDKYFAAPWTAPATTPDQRKAAKSLYEKVLVAHGGSAIKAANQIEWNFTTPYQEDSKQKNWNSRYALLGKDKFAQWEDWDAGRLFFVVDGKKGFDGKPGEVFGLHPTENRELTAQFARSVPGILLGAGGTPIKVIGKDTGFVMVRDDIVFNVILDPETSRIAQVEFKDKYNGPISHVKIEFSDYESVSGVWLPKTRRGQVNEGEWTPTRSTSETVINRGIPVVFSDVK